MIRTFDLKNSKNEVYTLAVANKHTGFLYDVTGLGMEHTAEYQQLGNTFEALTDNINQAVISGTVLFFNPYAYQEFLRFAAFCQDKTLKMHYRTPAGEFWRDGSVTKIEKSENNDCLKVHIDFTTVSLWYREISETKSGNIVYLVSDSAIESPCHIIFNGLTIENSSFLWDWKTIEESSPHYGSISGVSIASTDTLHIRTDVNPYTIYKLSSSNVKTDLYNKSSFSTERFPFIRKGRNMIYTNYGNPSSVTVNARIYYETV